MSRILGLLIWLAATPAFAQSASQLCQMFSNHYQSQHALQCLQTAGGVQLQPEAYRLCEGLINHYQFDQASNCIQTARYASFDRSAISVCQTVHEGYQHALAVTCLRQIANRQIYGGVNLCQDLARSYRYDEAVSCLGSLAQPLPSPNPYPLPYPNPYPNPYPPAPYPYPVPSPDPYPPRPIPPSSGQNPPPVKANYCYVQQTGQWVDGDEFFQVVSRWADRNNRCAIARISRVPSSGRVYDRTGRRLGKQYGGLSHSETEEVLRQHRLYGCERFTCTERN